MRTPDIEGVATRDGPESCAGTREGAGEALTGVRAGWAIEPRNHRVRGADAVVRKRKATPPAALSRVAGGPARGQRPCACTEPPCARTGRSRARPSGRSAGGPLREGRGRTPEMNERGKSDNLVVPAKPPNKAGGPVAEVVEGRCGVPELGHWCRPGLLRGPLVFADEAAEDGSALDPLLGEVGDRVVGTGRVQLAAAVGATSVVLRPAFQFGNTQYRGSPCGPPK